MRQIFVIDNGTPQIGTMLVCPTPEKLAEISARNRTPMRLIHTGTLNAGAENLLMQVEAIAVDEFVEIDHVDFLTFIFSVIADGWQEYGYWRSSQTRPIPDPKKMSLQLFDEWVEEGRPTDRICGIPAIELVSRMLISAETDAFVIMNKPVVHGMVMTCFAQGWKARRTSMIRNN